VKLSLRLPRFEKIRETLQSRAGSLCGGVRLVARREVLFITATAFLSVVVTLIVLTVSSNTRERRAAAEVPQKQGEVAVSGGEGALSVDDFLLPAAPQAEQPPAYYAFRLPVLKWTRENVDKFWVAPRDIAGETIGTINDRNMENMFEKIP
jgi:hypothetical protein